MSRFFIKFKSLIACAFVLGCFFEPVWAQKTFQTSEKDWAEKARLASSDSSIAQNIVTVGRSFLGAPYASGTLDRSKGPEALSTNFRELDCVTFVETVAAICLQKKGAKTSDFEGFKAVLTSLRYRNGLIDGYSSRLHYFSEWLVQQERTGRVELLSEALGGDVFSKKISFMTDHRQLYKGLADPKAFEKMRLVEAELSRQRIFWLPKQRVAAIESQLRDGDLVAICSLKRGLDMAHEGFVVWQNGRPHLLHASSEHKKVVISERPLSDYLARNNGQTGIMIARFR